MTAVAARGRVLLIAGLAAAAFATAVAVVVTKHQSRKLFVEVQALEARRDALDVEWNRLQLEESAWSTQARIETVARTRLDMKVPEAAASGVLQRR